MTGQVWNGRGRSGDGQRAVGEVGCEGADPGEQRVGKENVGSRMTASAKMTKIGAAMLPLSPHSRSSER